MWNKIKRKEIKSNCKKEGKIKKSGYLIGWKRLKVTGNKKHP